MSIKIDGTAVIDTSSGGSIKYKNLLGLEGQYNDAKPIYAANTHESQNAATVQHIAAADTTSSRLYGENLTLEADYKMGGFNSQTNGDQYTFLVDTSDNLHDISFDTTDGEVWHFADDSEPDFTTARYWMITVTAWDGTNITVTTQSWGA